MELKRIVAALGELAPLELAEAWDNVGLLVGDPGADVARVLLTVDYTREVADEAQREGCQLVVSYHPPVFKGLTRITAGMPIYDAVRHGIALYSPHTALDVVEGGTNDLLGDALGLLDREPLRPAAANPRIGMGRLGAVAPVAVQALLERVKDALEVERLLVAGPVDREVRRAAACAGACGEILDTVLLRRADFYLTGELRHHDALRAAAAGLTVVCTLHSNSERAVLKRLKARLADSLGGVHVQVSRQDRDPFRWV